LCAAAAESSTYPIGQRLKHHRTAAIATRRASCT
jgi:hypothetical protein